MENNVAIFVGKDRIEFPEKLPATRIVFSPFQLFGHSNDDEKVNFLKVISSHLIDLKSQGRSIAVAGDSALLDMMLQAEPDAAQTIAMVLTDPRGLSAATLPTPLADKPRCDVAAPDALDVVFVADLHAFAQMRLERLLPAGTTIVDLTVLADLVPDRIPASCWSRLDYNIYPIAVPDIVLESGLDMVLMDCPSRNLAMLPNGLGYVHNALKRTGIKFQTFDLDIVTYHRYHIHRLYDCGGRIELPSGRVMPVDPWQAEHYDLWAFPEVVDWFMPIIKEAAQAIIRARPKMIGFSVQQCNEHFTRRLINYIREAYPEIIVIVGGFSCYNAEIGRRSFPDCDYMCIGEADQSVGPLVEALARGETVRNFPGVLSRFDDPGTPYIPAPMPHNLDVLPYPRYEWFGLDIYQNYNGYRLVPVIASRGCRWSRCSFCAERFYWRIRTAANFVDELEWLNNHGCSLFMFNESDLNGQPDRVIEICDEIIRRKLKVRLTGQLRVNKLCGREFYAKLREAGFVSLRFGVDAFSENTLRLQKKGYTKAMVSETLRACAEVGIYTEVNWVIGIPGETDADVDEGIDFILENRSYIGRLANINPLILCNGSVYWIDPDSHNIHFRAERQELYELHPRAIPAHLWYSTEPYIDANVRKQRFEYTVRRLHTAGFPIGAWAERIIKDVEENTDISRAGPSKADANYEDVALHRPEPILKLEREAHRIYEYAGFFYAVPRHVNDLGFLHRQELPLGVLKEYGFEALLRTLDEAQGWADLRGGHDPRWPQRRAAEPIMRADATMGDFTAPADTAPGIDPDSVIIRHGRHHFALAAEDASRLDGPIRNIFSTEMDIQFIQNLAGYKILKHEAMYLAAPLDTCWITIDMADQADRHGILCSNDLAALRETVLARAGQQEQSLNRLYSRGSGPHEFNDRHPRDLSRLEGYRLVSYEGWIYGLPPELRDVDLEAVDVIEMPGVIRDVSLSVVEEEILHRSALRLASD